MADREQSENRDEQRAGDEQPSESRRQQAEKASESDAPAGRDSTDEGSTPSRPRGHTEDPDTTL